MSPIVSERVQYEAYLFTLPDHSYTDCHDYTHPGYSALSQATQLLFNDICNEYIHVWHSTTAIAATYRDLILILLFCDFIDKVLFHLYADLL